MTKTKVGSLGDLLKSFASAVMSTSTPAQLDSVSSLIAGSTRALDLHNVPQQVANDVRRVLEKIDPNSANSVIAGLTSAKLADRIAATQRLHTMILEIAVKGVNDLDPKGVQAVIDKLGVDALLAIPGMTVAYRRHLSAGGKAKDFAEFITSKRNRRLALVLKGVLGDATLRTVFRVDVNRVFTVSLHAFMSNIEAERAVVAGLRQAAEILGQDLFVKLLLSKNPHLMAGDIVAFTAALMDVLKKGELPKLSPADLQKMFRVADRSALQGPVGELLSLVQFAERAKTAAAKSKSGKVYILLETRADTVRTLVAKSERGDFVKPVADVTVEQLVAGKQVEKSAAAVTSSFKKQEFTDGLLVEFDSAKRLKLLAKQESKVDQTGVVAGLVQIDKTREDIEAISKLTIGTIIEVTKDSMRHVPLEEARQLSGGKIVDGLLEIAEDTKLTKTLQQLEEAADGSLAQATALAKARADRKLQNLNGAEKIVVVGKGQLEDLQKAGITAVRTAEGATKLEDVTLIHYGHEYEALRDLVVRMLATLPFRTT